MNQSSASQDHMRMRGILRFQSRMLAIASKIKATPFFKYNFGVPYFAGCFCVRVRRTKFPNLYLTLFTRRRNGAPSRRLILAQEEAAEEEASFEYIKQTYDSACVDFTCRCLAGGTSSFPHHSGAKGMLLRDEK